MATGVVSRESDLPDVQAARQGDREAFARLAESHTGLVRVVVSDHVRAPDDVADCIQETFTKALRNLPRLKDPLRFRPWLTAIARHVAIDHRRRRNRDLALVGPILDATDEPRCPRPTPESVVTRRQLDSTVRARLIELPAREATAVTMASYQDRSPSEIADHLGVSVGNAKLIVHRGRRRLRHALVTHAHDTHQIDCPGLAETSEPSSATLGEHLSTCPCCLEQARLMLRSSD